MLNRVLVNRKKCTVFVEEMEGEHYEFHEYVWGSTEFVKDSGQILIKGRAKAPDGQEFILSLPMCRTNYMEY